MNHENSILWLLALFAALFAAPRAEALVATTPAMAGYAGGKFSAPSGGFTPSGSGYSAPATLNIGGKTVPLSGFLKPSSGVGSLIKGALSRTPWGLIAGTLAAGWLLDSAMQWDSDVGQWVLAEPSGYTQIDSSTYGYPSFMEDNDGSCNTALPGPYWCTPGDGFLNACISGYYWCIKNGTKPEDLIRPATPEDWDALPDPLPALAPELPYAPYLPGGVPVDAPEYAPQTVELGSPYIAPDGSTWQPKADIQPAGDGQVRVRPYDEKTKESDGTPVPPSSNPPTIEPPPEQSTQCDKYPDSLGCAKLGTSEAMPNIPVTEIPIDPIDATPTPIGTAGTCPADVTVSVMGKPITISYSPICDFAGMIRPLVIGFAWLGFAFIVAGVVRS